MTLNQNYDRVINMRFVFRIILLAVVLIVAITHFTKASPAESHVVCLAKNMYYEARNQGTAGLLAVVSVVFNRVNDPRFPNSICEVIKQGQAYKNGKMVLHKCQFSWYCDGKRDEITMNTRAWSRALDYASIVLSGRIVMDVTQGSLWYHAYYVKPSWARQKERVTRIDSHIFYRRKK